MLRWDAERCPRMLGSLIPAQGMGAEHQCGMLAASPPCATTLPSPVAERGSFSHPFAVRYHQTCKIRGFFAVGNHGWPSPGLRVQHVGEPWCLHRHGIPIACLRAGFSWPGGAEPQARSQLPGGEGRGFSKQAGGKKNPRSL